MEPPQSAATGGYGWLIVGALAGAAPFLLPASWLAVLAGGPEALSGWRRLPLGILLFGFFTALYFRAHWVATVTALRARDAELAEAHGRLADYAEEAERSAQVLVENLHELSGEAPAATRRLYLEGALAHASKLREALESIRLRCARLRTGGPAAEQ